jgi:hypothetical protein
MTALGFAADVAAASHGVGVFHPEGSKAEGLFVSTPDLDAPHAADILLYWHHAHGCFIIVKNKFYRAFEIVILRLFTWLG